MTLIRDFVNKYSGLLVGIEGVDGSGKTVLSQALALGLEQAGYDNLVFTKEPGGTKFGLQLREILQYRSDPLDPKAEYLLFASDRAQHFSELVIPSLQNGKIVISDRTGDSSIVYQGLGHGLDIEMIKQVNAWATCDHRPDLTLYLRVDAETASARVHKRAEDLTVFEREHQSAKTIAGFDELYKDREDVLVLDGKLPTADLAKIAVEKIILLAKEKDLC